MNSNRGNLILQSARRALCQPHALQSFTIFGFFKVDSVLYWVVMITTSKLLDKISTKCTLPFSFPNNFSWKNYLFMGAQVVGHWKRNAKQKYIALNRTFEFKQYLLTPQVLYLINQRDLMEKEIWRSSWAALTRLCGGEWCWDKATFFNLWNQYHQEVETFAMKWETTHGYFIIFT